MVRWVTTDVGVFPSAYVLASHNIFGDSVFQRKTADKFNCELFLEFFWRLLLENDNGCLPNTWLEIKGFARAVIKIDVDYRP